MTTNSDASNSTASLDEQLVAYLDGELDQESGSRIEALLATDPKLRRRLQSLERTWDLLDELDTAPIGEPFTHSTLEMVTQAAREEVERDQNEAPRRRRRWRLGLAAILLLSAAAGFAAVALIVPDTDRQLLEDLPLLERFDEYRYAESVEFLRMLRDEGLFLEKGADSSAADSADADYSPAERRGRVSDMSPDEKVRLRLVNERFNHLTPDERQHLRQLYEALRNDPDAVRLQAIMCRYYDWLKTLSPYSRAGLAEIEPKERVKWIKKRTENERLREGGGRLGEEDLMKLRKWVSEYAKSHEAELMKTLSQAQSEVLRKRLAKFSPEMRRFMLLGQMMQWWQEGDPQRPPPIMSNEEMAQLRKQLSTGAQKRLQSVSPELRWKMVAVWLQRGMRRPGPFRGEHGAPTPGDDELLADFFEKELTPEERDRLLSLPAEDMQRELHRKFLMRTRSFEGPPYRHPGGFNPGKRPPAERPKPKKPTRN